MYRDGLTGLEGDVAWRLPELVSTGERHHAEGTIEGWSSSSGQELGGRAEAELQDATVSAVRDGICEQL